MAGTEDLPRPANPTSSSPTSTSNPTIHIGTRKSRLALIQTNIVHQALLSAWPSHAYEIHSMSTMGDKNQTTPLHDFGAKALWTHELEGLLLEMKLDLIVHSLKGTRPMLSGYNPQPQPQPQPRPQLTRRTTDMPTQLPPALTIGAILAREDPRDALVMKPSLASRSIADLPAGSIVGTSSVRRSAQISRLFPGLKFADVRGNVETRLRKLDSPEADGVQYACLILAAAGLKRLDLGHRITQYLDSKNGGLLHAVGQGALGIEIREADEPTRALLSKLAHRPTTLACLAERSLMRTLEGGCSVPIGVETHWVGDDGEPVAEKTARLWMKAIVVSLDGRKSVEKDFASTVESEQDAEEFGFAMANKLVEAGAGDILKEINLNRDLVDA